MDYKIEITDSWQYGHGLKPLYKLYTVTVFVDGKLYMEHPNITLVHEAGQIALYYETFFKYYKQN